jgi:hypothetical protein
VLEKQAESTEMADTTAVAVDTTVVEETPNIVGVAGKADFQHLWQQLKPLGW